MNLCHTRFSRTFCWVLLLGTLTALWPAVSSAQSVSKMRDYLHLRDALAERKSRIQTELTRAPEVGPVDARLDIRKVQQELVQVEDWLKKLEDNEEGLTGYYRDRIARLISEIRYLLPALEKREASLAALQTTGTVIAVTPAPAPAQVAPIQASPTTSLASSSLAIASDAISELAPARVPPPPPELSKAERKKRRKAYFASMGVRLLRNATLKKPVAQPTVTPIVAVTATATVPVAVKPTPATAPAPLQVPAVPTPVVAAGIDLT
ncbi:MAG TPA: hypothetical protein PKO06_19890, partial [Candidatus Ozemobacteraceae bacterium]|nr:hypothetical protein [Candidatus Ozemobacteraceae bacterium]